MAISGERWWRDSPFEVRCILCIIARNRCGHCFLLHSKNPEQIRRFGTARQVLSATELESGWPSRNKSMKGKRRFHSQRISFQILRLKSNICGWWTSAGQRFGCPLRAAMSLIKRANCVERGPPKLQRVVRPPVETAVERFEPKSGLGSRFFP